MTGAPSRNKTTKPHVYKTPSLSSRVISLSFTPTNQNQHRAHIVRNVEKRPACILNG